LDELLRGVTPATYTKRFGDGSSAASPETATARDSADAIPSADSRRSSSCDTMDADSDCDTKLLSGTQLQLAGLPQCLERTSVYLKRWLNDALITKEMLLGTKDAAIRQALEAALEGIQNDHGVSIEMTDDKIIISGYSFARSASDASVNGPREALSQLMKVRMDAIEEAWVDTSASLVEAKRLKYPLEWECRKLDHPQKSEVQESRFVSINTTDKKSTVRGKCEYTRIKKKLRADVPAATNIKVHIFQDKQKWCTSSSVLPIVFTPIVKLKPTFPSLSLPSPQLATRQKIARSRQKTEELIPSRRSFGTALVVLATRRKSSSLNMVLTFATVQEGCGGRCDFHGLLFRRNIYLLTPAPFTFFAGSLSCTNARLLAQRVRFHRQAERRPHGATLPLAVQSDCR